MKVSKKWSVLVIKIFLALFCMAVIFFNIEELYDFKVKLYSIGKKKINLSQYQPLEDKGNEWYMNNFLIAHACGGVDGVNYTNSKEAFEESIMSGFQVIEVDFSKTSDNKVVLKHNWNSEKGPTYEQFMNSPVEYAYTPMDAEMLLDLMIENPEVYIVTDIKGEREYMGDIYTQIVEMAESKKCTDVLNRFIIQIYFPEDYDYFKDIYSFSNWIYTFYNSGEKDFNSAAEFCLTHDIHVVAMPFEWIQEKNYIDVFKKYNIKVYVHTLNRLSTIQILTDWGISGVYTDYLTPADLESIEIK